MFFVHIFLFLFAVSGFVLFCACEILSQKNKKFKTVLVTSAILLLNLLTIFLKSKLKNSQRWYLLGRTSGDFCDDDLHFVVVILHLLHLSMFFILLLYLHLISRLLYHVTGTPLVLSSTSTTFDCLFFFICRERYGFDQAFFTHRRFLPYVPSWHLGATCFYQAFTGSRHLLSWKPQGFILIFETQIRPICLFDSQ